MIDLALRDALGTVTIEFTGSDDAKLDAQRYLLFHVGLKTGNFLRSGLLIRVYDPTVLPSGISTGAANYEGLQAM